MPLGGHFYTAANRSADVFIDGAVALANKLNVPSFLIGVIILGLGTSAPEMIVSMLAALEGSPGLALGNAYGSNIVNIALVLGATVLISPIIIRKSIIVKLLYYSYKIRKKLEITHRLSRSTILYAYV